MNQMEDLVFDQPQNDLCFFDMLQFERDMDWQTGVSSTEHTVPYGIFSANRASSPESATNHQSLQAPLILIRSNDTVSAVDQPKHKKKSRQARRAANASAEKSYRERLNVQVDNLEEAISQYRTTPDMDDMSPIMDRTRPKGEIIDNATEHIADLWSRFKLRKETNDILFSRIEGLEKLTGCENCPVMITALSQLHGMCGCQQKCVDAPSSI